MPVEHQDGAYVIASRQATTTAQPFLMGISVDSRAGLEEPQHRLSALSEPISKAREYLRAVVRMNPWVKRYRISIASRTFKMAALDATMMTTQEGLQQFTYEYYD